MLKSIKKVTLEGNSIIDGVIVAHFTAAINSDDPNQMTLTSTQVNKAACKEHRVAVRKDEAEFEDYAYAIQDEMLSSITPAN